MTTPPADALWMTQAALDRLEAELVELTAPGRVAEEGDQPRILQLRDMIRRAEVSAKPDDGLVEPGMLVTLRFQRDGSEQTFLLGSREVVGAESDVDVYSPTSPLGAAISGRTVGDTVSYAAPSGAQIEVVIQAAVPFA